MTKREQRFLILLIIIVIIFMSYMFVFKKQFKDIETLESQIAAETSLIDAYEKSDVEIKSLKDDISDLEVILRSDYQAYLSDIRQEEIILLLNEILLRSEINVSSLNFSDFSDGVTEMLDYETFNVSINLTGGYKEVMNFVSSFWRFDHNIYVSSLNLTSGAEEGDLSGVVDITFVKVNNDYASDVKLFEWYSDIIYQKEDPFEATDFSNLFLPNYFYTGTDVDFYNPEHEPFSDISGHWAEELLNLFGRNGYLLGDEANNIYPDQLMTRLETVLLLDLVFRWELNDEFADLTSFSDFNLIADLDDVSKKSLIKAYNSGYLYGYEDNTLRPLSNISYEELGFIGSNLLEDDTITWPLVARELEVLTAYRSLGLDDLTGNATKAEIVYFLAYIDDKLND